MNNKTYGQIGYEAYRAHTGGKSLATGQEIPLWQNLAPVIQAAWEAAGEAIADTFRVDNDEAIKGSGGQ